MTRALAGPTKAGPQVQIIHFRQIGSFRMTLVYLFIHNLRPGRPAGLTRFAKAIWNEIERRDSDNGHGQNCTQTSLLIDLLAVRARKLQIVVKTRKSTMMDAVLGPEMDDRSAWDSCGVVAPEKFRFGNDRTENGPLSKPFGSRDLEYPSPKRADQSRKADRR